MSNKHISQFLDYYIKLPNPQYAVLLKGKWGSGKTHFINEYKDKLKENKQRYIYVSLYGVKNYDEIETKFLQSSNPEIFNEKSIFVGKLADAFINENIKKSLGQMKKSLSSLNAKGNILIFDDVERCSINIVDLLGYINNFVEHQSYKVILLANEEELEKTKKYKKIKEKLVGKTFEFKTDANLAYDSFLSELKNENKINEKILEKEKANILELFEKSESNNLRALRQNLLDFERFYDEILTTHLEKKELIKDILYWFFLFSFEIRQGNSDILDLPKLSEEYHSLSFYKKEDEAEKTKYKSFLNKYKLNDDSNVIISFDLWKEILLNSNIQKDEIDLSLRNSKYYFDENTPSWQKLTNWYNLGDDEFEELLKDVYKRFCDNEYKDYRHFKLVASMLLFFQEKKLFNTEFNEFFDLVKKNFKLLFDENSLNFKDVYFIKNEHDGNHYQNKGYFESDSFKLLLNYIDEFLEEKKSLKLQEDSQLIIDAIKTQNHKKVFELLEGKNDKRIFDYKDKPILSQINIDDLFNSLMKTNGVTMYYLGGIIKDRYNYGTKELLCEETFLRELLEKINNYLEKNEVKVSTYNLKKEVKANIIIALERIEKNKEIIKQTSNV